MADLTPAAFQAKWNQRFADNDTFTIDEHDLREFAADQLRTFVARAEQLGKTLQELMLPQAVVAGGWYITASGIWEARSSFSASAAPVNGPNWRVVWALQLYSDIQALAAVANQKLATFEVTAPSGQVSYVANWADLAYIAPKSTVRLRGSYGSATTDYAFPIEMLLLLEMGSIFTCRNLYVHGGPAGADNWKTRAIGGAGTLRGKILWYGDSYVRLTLEDFRHEGEIEQNAYPTQPIPDSLRTQFVAKNITGIGPTGLPYASFFHKSGANYTAWYQAAFYNCQLKANGAPAIKVYSLNNDVSTDTDGKANNVLRLVGNTFSGDGSNKVLDTSQAGTACRFQFGGNYADRIQVPTELIDTTFQAFGVGGSGSGTGAPAGPPAAPTITSQTDTNPGGEIGFTANATHPAFGDYEYRTTVTGKTASGWKACTAFTILLENEAYAAGAVEIRVAAADGNPAGSKAVSTVAFTQFLYQIMLRDISYANGQLTVSARNSADGNTGIFVDGGGRLGYVSGPTNQYNTNTFAISLAPGQHTLVANDGSGAYTTPIITFTVT